jgi:hypothetical protein
MSARAKSTVINAPKAQWIDDPPEHSEWWKRRYTDDS